MIPIDLFVISYDNSESLDFFNVREKVAIAEVEVLLPDINLMYCVASTDGVEYPLAKVEITSASHPFFTGTMKIIDTAGRVERFERRYGSRRKG